MDKIEKFFRKLSAKEKEAILLMFQQIKVDFTKIPGLIKLKGYRDIYRVRIGNYRIIFKKAATIEILKISKRDEQTYKNF